MNNSIKIYPLYFGLLIAVLISGCVYYRSVSKLYVDETVGWRTESWVYSGVRQSWLYGKDVSLMVRPHNYGEHSAITIWPIPLVPIKGKDGSKGSFFAISLVFDKGDGSLLEQLPPLRFDPYQVTLHQKDGSILQPIGYIKPKYNDQRCYSFDYKKQYEELHELPNGWLDLTRAERGTCFYLLYGVEPPSTADTFLLEMNGLVMENKKVNVPKMMFRKGFD